MDLKSFDSFDKSTQALIMQSSVARTKSYSPYSNFAVGAAILCEDGTIVTGCNVECASLGLTNCAERTAIFKAVSEGKRKFLKVAVSAVNGDQLTAPCGSCRQVLCEFNPRIQIYLFNPETKLVGSQTLEYFLPHSFNPETVTFNNNTDH